MIEILEYTRDAEAKIAKTARVCYAKQQQANETKDAALLQNLARRKHWAPFEFADMTVKITCDRAVANAFTRHRHGSFMQQSTHYVNMVKQPPSFVCPFREDGNREAWLATIELYEQCEKTYAKLLTLGVSAAEARIVMPLGLETTLIMKANARTL